MHFSLFDLRQFDEQMLLALPLKRKNTVLVNAIADLKEAHERLQANSKSSSRPPSSDPPWSGKAHDDEQDSPGPTSGESPAGKSTRRKSSSSEPNTGQRKRPGRQCGATGHSRCVTLPITETLFHKPASCVRCAGALDPQRFVARTGLYVLDVEIERERGLLGLQVRHDKHLYGEIECRCGHITRSQPGRCTEEPLWSVALSEWHLVGPTLASLIVCLSHRLHVSRRRTREFLRDWLGVELSTATLTHCLHEAGRAVEPLEQQLVDELQQADLVHVDETGWNEWGETLWLWVITTSTLCLYFIGYRTGEILDNVFEKGFAGWLMSDGYVVYRQFEKRLRCWAHLKRKARGVQLSLSPSGRRFGKATRELLSEFMGAVYRARERPPRRGKIYDPKQLDAFRALCEQYRNCRHEKTRELAREFLNDWDAIWAVLDHPWLPLTNNEAERALRHWVIARRISYGTRTAQGSRALALLASVIETCRKRDILPWPYLAQVIAERRQGRPAPALPTPVLSPTQTTAL